MMVHSFRVSLLRMMINKFRASFCSSCSNDKNMICCQLNPMIYIRMDIFALFKVSSPTRRGDAVFSQ
jgi:hypothetical protein